MADTTATSNLAPMYGDYVTNYLSKGQALGGLPYQPYTGDRFAGASQLQNQAFTGIGGLALPSELTQASGYFNQAAQQASQGSNYTPTNFTAPGYTASTVSNPGAVGFNAIQAGTVGPMLDAGNTATVNRFMDPYQQSVTDIAAREAERRYAASIPGLDAAAAKAGAFGGSRHGLIQSEAYRDLNQQLNDIQMKGSSGAFNAAQQALNAQRQAQLQGDTTNLGAYMQSQLANQNAGINTGQFNANMQYNTGLQNAQMQNQANQFGATQGLDAQRFADQSKQFAATNSTQGLSSLLGAAQGLGSLGSNIFGNQLSGYNAMLGAGGIQQGINQQPLDFGYQQWEQSQKYPYEQLNFQKNLLQGLPLSVNQTASTNPLLEGLMGAGGLYQLLTGGG